MDAAASVSPQRPARMRLARAAGIFLTGLLARWALNPVLGEDHAYSVFYPGVIFAAYFLGARPAALTAALSALAGYWLFDAPVLTVKADLAGLTTLAFFALTSTVAIYFITGMRRALEALAAERARAEGLARSHAGLFQELNERVTNHLQLVAALLQVQARDEVDPSLAAALAEASARTLLISRVHRGLSDGPRTLDFNAFARQLVDGALAARGCPQVRVDLGGLPLRLPTDQATSVAIVLLECLYARLDQGDASSMRVEFSGDDSELVLQVTTEGPTPAPRLALIEAMVEQLGGRFVHRFEGGDATSALAFPRFARPLAEPPPPAFAPAAAATLH